MSGTGMALVSGFDIQSFLQIILFEVCDLGAWGEIGLLAAGVLTIIAFTVRGTLEQKLSLRPHSPQAWRSLT